jgi:hypothetical protein
MTNDIGFVRWPHEEVARIEVEDVRPNHGSDLAWKVKNAGG